MFVGMTSRTGVSSLASWLTGTAGVASSLALFLAGASSSSSFGAGSRFAACKRPVIATTPRPCTFCHRRFWIMLRDSLTDQAFVSTLASIMTPTAGVKTSILLPASIDASVFRSSSARSLVSVSSPATKMRLRGLISGIRVWIVRRSCKPEKSMYVMRHLTSSISDSMTTLAGPSTLSGSSSGSLSGSAGASATPSHFLFWPTAFSFFAASAREGSPATLSSSSALANSSGLMRSPKSSARLRLVIMGNILSAPFLPWTSKSCTFLRLVRMLTPISASV